jgi:REP element-mobilizing transposase RayT
MKTKQRTLKFVGHGGQRSGAGRKRAKGSRSHTSHKTRVHAYDVPAHVTLRLVDGLPSLRDRALYIAVEDAIRAGCYRFGFRVVEFSVQANHIHLLTEADTKIALSRGMQGLVIRIARAINKQLGRRGKVFADRFHHRELTTPTEVRNCLVYVLNNARHHGPRVAAMPRNAVDPYSSATWFEGWSADIQSTRLLRAAPVTIAETWLMLRGWKKAGGLIAPWEVPKEPKRSAKLKRI